MVVTFYTLTSVLNVLVASFLCQHLVLFVFFILAISLCLKWCLFVILTCISLMIKDVEHFLVLLPFMYLFFVRGLFK